MYFSVFSLKQLNCFSDSSASSVLCNCPSDSSASSVLLIKWYHSYIHCEKYRNCFRYTIFWNKSAMCNTSIFTCIMTMISSITIFFIFKIFIFKLFFTNIVYKYCCSFVNNFIFFFLKLFIFIACFLKYSQNLFIHCLPVCIECLFPFL